MIKNKKALSEIVAYVLLVVIAVSLSLLVYAWLKGYILKPSRACPEGLSISLKDYSCDVDLEKITLTLKNNGRFNIQGFMVRISNSSAKAINYLEPIMNNIPTTDPYFGNLTPGQEFTQQFNYGKHELITRIEIQPFIVEKGKVLCPDIYKQDINGCS